MAQDLIIGLAQFPAGTRPDPVCAAAADRGCDIVVFPEMFSNGYAPFDADVAGAREAWIDHAERLDGNYLAGFRDAARAYDIHVVATLLERAEPKPFNTAVLIDRAGETSLVQRKRHICFFGVPEEACGAGTTSHSATIETRHGPVAVGLMICMDREYPEVALDLARAGAEVILVPNACDLVDDPEVGDVRVGGTRARAFEHVMGIAVANYPAPKHDGHSFAVNATGQVVTMGGTGAELVVTKLDVDEIRATQKREWFRRPTQ